MNLIEKFTKMYVKNRRSRNRIIMFRVILALCVFTMTYLLLAPDAITMESTEPKSSFVVWHDEKITENETENKINFNLQQNTLLKSNSNTLFLSPVQSYAMSSNSFSDSFDFEDSISTITTSVYEDGIFVVRNKFEDGDRIKMEVNYSITVPPGEDYDVISCKLPDIVDLVDNAYGIVYDSNGKPVGTYVIRPDGFIVITFDKGKFDTTESYTGKFSFEGIVSMSSEHEGYDIVFDKDELTYDYIKKQEETVTPSGADLSTTKSVSSKQQDGSYIYTVMVSSKEGTNGETINLKDKFLCNTYGGQDANYDETTIEIIKHTETGEEEVTGYTPTVNNTALPSSFSVDNLPALDAGESYEIRYRAKPDIDLNNTNTDGSMKLGNEFHAQTETINKYSYVSINISGAVIEKSGSYNVDTEIGSWEVGITPGLQDLVGQIVSDTITLKIKNNDGTTVTKTIEVKTAKIKDLTTGVITDIELPYTFTTDNFDKTHNYEINYDVNLSSYIPENTIVNVSNKVEIKEDGEEKGFEATDPLNPIYKDTYNFEKEFVDVDTDNNKYHWQSTITVPSTEYDAISGLVYTDTIDTWMKNYNNSSQIPNAHYTTVSELRDIGITVGGTPVNSRDYTIQYYPLTGQTGTLKNITDVDENVRGFVIVFSKEFLNFNKSTDMDILIDYNTVINTKILEVNTEYSINNSATVGNHEDDAHTSYEKEQGLDKEVKINGNYIKNPVGSQNPIDSIEYDVIYDEDLKCAVMTYRLTFKTDLFNLLDLQTAVLTDFLPDGSHIIGKPSYYFTNIHKNHINSMYVKTSTYKKDYDAKDYLTCDTTDASKLKFSLTKLFFTEHDHLLYAVSKNTNDKSNNNNNVEDLTFFIEYQIALPPPSSEEWNGETSIDFINRFAYGTEEVSSEVTVESDEQFVSKTGWREPLLDDNGNQMVDGNNNPIYTNNMKYKIVINQQAQNLSLSGDKVQVKDTMKFINAHGSVARFIYDEFKIYELDSTKPGGKVEIPVSECGLETEIVKTDNVDSYVFSLNVPDKKAILIEYTYQIDQSEEVTGDDFSIANSVLLEGENNYEDREETVIEYLGSQAVVEQQSLTLYKHEFGNEAVYLEGAEFTFQRWLDLDNDGVYAWEKTVLEKNNVLTTDENGEIRIDLFDGVNQIYNDGVVYKFTETKAPQDYRLDPTPKYFVFVKNKTDENGNVLIDYKRDVFRYANEVVEIPEGVYVKDIIFIVNNSTRIPITNVKNRIEVEKEWTDTNGEPIESWSSEIEVDVYKQETKPIGHCTVTVTSTASGNSGTLERDITKKIEIAKGSNLAIAVFNSSETGQEFKVGDAWWKKGIRGSVYPHVVYYRLYDIQEDTLDIKIHATTPGYLNQTFDFYFFDFTEAIYEVDDTKDKVKVGTYQLTKENDWHIEWKLNNELAGTEGYLEYSPAGSENPYYYTVEEKDSSIPRGFEVQYSDNNINGINNGVITVTNVQNEIIYVLPSTGGTGKTPYKILGVMAFIVTTIIYIQKKYLKRKVI